MDRKFFGSDPPSLDAIRARLLDWFWVLRRACPQEQGISFSLTELRHEDPILLGHLRAMDDEFFQDRLLQSKDKEIVNTFKKKPQ